MNTISRLALVLLLVASAGRSSAKDATTTTWVDNNVSSAQWSTHSNWTTSLTSLWPLDDVELVFPATASAKNPNNNLLSATIFGLTFTGSGYMVSSNPLVLDEAVAGSGAPAIHATQSSGTTHFGSAISLVGNDVLVAVTGVDSSINPTGATLADLPDNTVLPTVSVSAGVPAVEGDSLTFIVVLSAVHTEPVTVSYATSDGTATAPADYIAASGSVTIPAGQTSAAVSVQTLEDDLEEADETVHFTISNPVNAVLGTASATGIITDAFTVNLSGIALGRNVIYQHILSVLDSPTYAYTGFPSLSGATRVIFKGFYLGKPATIRFTAGGDSPFAIGPLVEGSMVPFLDSSQSGTPGGEFLTSPVFTDAVPHAAFSDVHQEISDFPSPVLPVARRLWVNPYLWLAGIDAPAEFDTITRAQLLAFFQSGSTTLDQITGDSGHQSSEVRATGRSPVSGTRIVVQSATFHPLLVPPTNGRNLAVAHWRPEFGGSPVEMTSIAPFVPAGDGFASAVPIRNALTASNQIFPGFLISYQLTPDADVSISLGAKALAIEGVHFSPAAVADGSYPVWGYQWLFHSGNHPPARQSFLADLTHLARTNPPPFAVRMSDMEVHRTVEGGPLLPGSDPVVVLPPCVTAQSATPEFRSAVLSATVDPNGASTDVIFEYGPTPAYGFVAAASPSPVDSYQTVTAPLTGLEPDTVYHFRARAENTAGVSFGPTATFETGTILNINGSTVGRRALINSIFHLYSSDLAYGYTGTLPDNPVQANFRTNISGKPLLIRWSASGSTAGGLGPLATGGTVGFLPESTVLSPVGLSNIAVGADPSMPDATLGDLFQASTDHPSPLLVDRLLWVNPYAWLVGKDAPPASPADISFAELTTLFTNGSIRLDDLTGDPLDNSVNIFATGRDYPSATRRIVFRTTFGPVLGSAIAGQDLFVNQYQPIFGSGVWQSHALFADPIFGSPGNGGFVGAGSVRSALTGTTLLTDMSGFYISYLLAADAQFAESQGARILSVEGADFSAPSIADGSYPVWGYAHLFHRHSLAGLKRTVIDDLVTLMRVVSTPLPPGSVQLEEMLVHRRGDGAAILPGAEPPAVDPRPVILGEPVLAAASGSVPASFTADVSGPPGAIVLLEASADLGDADSWRVVAQIQLDETGNGRLDDVADPLSVGAESLFFRLLIDL